MPKVSVIIPVYRVEQYIRRCLESIMCQSLNDIEIIVINDCTPDKSMNIVRQYSRNDRRITIIDNLINQGPMMARRSGYKVATGDYITFCDGDDTMPKDALSLLYNKAVDEKADIVSGIIEYIPINGQRYRWKNQLSYGTDRIAAFRSLLIGEFGHNLSSRLFSRELLQNNDYETYVQATNGEDAMLFEQVLDNASKIVTIDDVVYEYWQHILSSSQKRLTESALKSIARANAMSVRIIGKYPELRKMLDEKISKSFWSFKVLKYDINKHYSEVGLSKYCSVISLIRYQRCTSVLKTMVKLLFPPKWAIGGN